MNYVISFNSDAFDLKNERKNTINPIHGISVGEWLNPILEKHGVDVTAIDEEDWGWYSYATLDRQKYLLGYIAIPEDIKEMFSEIIIQIHKERKLIDKLLGKNKMSVDDPFVKIVGNIIKSTKGFNDIEENNEA